jgi:hypothetical protein
MHWKQPITTECLKMDTATRLIFMEIMIRARNEDMTYPEFIRHGNKNISYQLKRGQSLFLSSNLKNVGFTRTTIERSLKLLSDKNSAINIAINRQPFGFIISINNYDELVSIAINSEIKQQSNSNQTTIKQHANNKNVNNDKPVKSVEVNLEAQEILNFYNETFSKNFKTAVGWKKNFEFWLTHYNLDEIKTAIRNLNHPNWWANKPKNGEPAELAKLDFLFRRSNSKGDCDYIGELLNLGEVENKQEPENVYRMSRSKFATEEELQRELAYYAECLPQWKVILID